MTIIAESGATKTDWRSVSPDGRIHAFKTEGMNVATADAAHIEDILRQAVAGLNPTGEQVSEIHFYAAGLISDGNPVPESVRNLDAVFRKSFPGAEIRYASDLLAAARALFGRRAGIAVILGTGSNSCEYDGEKIVRNVRSGGFILGDEGGAASLGRQFMADFLKGLVPKPVSDEFAALYKADYLTVVKNVYKGEAPARYLGSFAPFLVDRYGRYGYVKDLVDNNFRSLFKRCLSQYDISGKQVGAVGGFASAVKDILIGIAGEYGMKIAEIQASPADGLVRYHYP